eukprot:TRINITY_DN18859_c0_g1_i2.p1 TRINITY_DN18859_c0_g1~~TRINITY_DN18859_c0_g1_i2.p1  ORF type:complete len:228 (+),score=61.81 TRINITY_DN18859_c0_g1_i2:70-753(+)
MCIRDRYQRRVRGTEHAMSVVGTIRVPVIGDTMSGKSCLIHALKEHSARKHGIPNYEQTTDVICQPLEWAHQEEIWQVELRDTAGVRGEGPLAELVYTAANVVVVTVDMADKSSLQTVSARVAEVRGYLGSGFQDVILCGAKCDVWRRGEGSDGIEKRKWPVTVNEYWRVAEEVGARSFVMCSSTEGDGVKELRALILSTGANNARCLLYTSPSPRDRTRSRMPSSA